MPIIEPLEPERIEEKNWKRVMERTAETGAPDELFSRIMAHACTLLRQALYLYGSLL